MPEMPVPNDGPAEPGKVEATTELAPLPDTFDPSLTASPEAPSHAPTEDRPAEVDLLPLPTTFEPPIVPPSPPPADKPHTLAPPATSPPAQPAAIQEDQRETMLPHREHNAAEPDAGPAGIAEDTAEAEDEARNLQAILKHLQGSSNDAEAEEEEEQRTRAPSSPLSPLPELPTELPPSPTPPPPPTPPRMPTPPLPRPHPTQRAESSTQAQKRAASTSPSVAAPKRARPAAKKGTVVEDDLESISGGEGGEERLKEIRQVKVEEKDRAGTKEGGVGKGKKRKRKEDVAEAGDKPVRGAKVRQRVDAALGIKRDVSAPPEKVAPRGKPLTEQRIKELLKGQTQETQLAPCMRPRYAKWGKCVQCVAKLGGDSCRFRDVRVFPIDPETSEIVGEGWFESTEWKEPMTELPREFNAPLREGHIARIERTVAPLLLPLITRELRHIVTQKAIRREIDAARHRSVCDFCSSTIFGGYFLCRKCGRDFCLQCERYFSDSAATMRTSPWTIPDAARPKLQRCTAPVVGKQAQVEEAKKRGGIGGGGPVFHYRPDLQPVSRFDEAALRTEWTDLAGLVLDSSAGGDDAGEKKAVSGVEKLKLLGLDASDDLAKTLEAYLTTLPRPPSAPPRATSEEDLEKLYTTRTHPSQVVPDPAELEDQSLPFMYMHVDELPHERFDEVWGKGEPIVLDGVGDKFGKGWGAEEFGSRFGEEQCYVVDCQTNVSWPSTLGEFLEKFGKRDTKGQAILKVKDWPSTSDFSSSHPELYNDFCDALPVPDFTRRDGVLNLYSHFPPGPTRPDIGPKMYMAFEAKETKGGQGTTRLHMDVADAINVMLYASPMPDPASAAPAPAPAAPEAVTAPAPPAAAPRQDPLEAASDPAASGDESGPIESDAAPPPAASTEKPSSPSACLKPPVDGCAVWDLYPASAAPKLRAYLSQKYDKKAKFTDPIHSQLFYLDSRARRELWERYGVKGWRVYQYPGQAVFIPAGCAHQVCNLSDCIKIALDFVSPHNVKRCQQLSQDFRHENFVKAWKEDVLQLYNVLWFAWQNARETRRRLADQARAEAEAQSARAARLEALRQGQPDPLPNASTRTPPMSPHPPSAFRTAISSVRDDPSESPAPSPLASSSSSRLDSPARLPPPPGSPPPTTLDAAGAVPNARTALLKTLLANTLSRPEAPPKLELKVPSAATGFVKNKTKLSTSDLIKMGMMPMDLAVSVARLQMGQMGGVLGGLGSVGEDADGGEAVESAEKPEAMRDVAAQVEIAGGQELEQGEQQPGNEVGEAVAADLEALNASIGAIEKADGPGLGMEAVGGSEEARPHLAESGNASGADVGVVEAEGGLVGGGLEAAMEVDE